MSDETMTHKDETLRNMRREHEALAATLATLTPEQMTTPGVYADGNQDWTVKDILCHLIWWEQSAFKWFGQPIAVPRSAMPEGNLSEDEENQAIFDSNRDRALDEVLSNFERSYELLMQAMENTSAEKFDQPRASDPDGDPLWESIIGNTYEHYQIHHDSIRAWLGQSSH